MSLLTIELVVLQHHALHDQSLPAQPMLQLRRNYLESVTAAFLLFLALAFLMGPPRVANAAPPPSITPLSLPPLLRSLSRTGKIKIIRSFPTEKSGLTGYVVNDHGRNELVFAEGHYLFMGRLISPQGDDLTALYWQRYVPKPDVATIVRKLQKSGHLIAQGSKKAPILYVFADPNCIFCHRFYRMTEPAVKAGHLQLRWALVGFLKPSSANRAVAILSARDPSLALAENETRFNESDEEGGMTPDKSPAKHLRSVLRDNFVAMQSAGGEGTPTILYQTSARKWAVQAGLPTRRWLKAYLAGKTRSGN